MPLSTIEGSTDKTLTITWEDPQHALQKAAELTGREYLEAASRREIAYPPVAELIGIRDGWIDDDDCVYLTMKPDERHQGPFGLTHGGMLATLFDSVVASAIIARLQPGDFFSTLELKINFLKPVTSESPLLTAKATVIHFGRSSAVVEAVIYDDEGRRYTHGTSTCSLRRSGYETTQA